MTHLIFVFGTLKEGFRNAHVNRGRRVPGQYATQAPRPLYIVGARCLPWLLDRPGEGLTVFGELYAVDDGALAAMDALERIDSPGWYERRRVTVRAHPGGGPMLEPWVYFGSEAGFAGAAQHVDPIAEYTLEHQARYVPRAE